MAYFGPLARNFMTRTGHFQALPTYRSVPLRKPDPEVMMFAPDAPHWGVPVPAEYRGYIAVTAR